MFSGAQRNTRFVVYNPEEAKTFIESHENESTKKENKEWHKSAHCFFCIAVVKSSEK